MVLFALLGLAGYFYGEEIRFYPLNSHSLHTWIGIIALLLSRATFLDGIMLNRLIS
jgi:hypothetical protein